MKIIFQLTPVIFFLLFIFTELKLIFTGIFCHSPYFKIILPFKFNINFHTSIFQVAIYIYYVKFLYIFVFKSSHYRSNTNYLNTITKVIIFHSNSFSNLFH